jgi:S-adenosylmethionine hydrolase
MAGSVISLTTDFGLADNYVGIMKGVIAGICPQATLIDISHEIRPQAVRQASFLLSTAVPFFPPGTVHLVVVDPGVGSPRKPIAVQTDRAFYVAPNNGVLSMALRLELPRLAVHIRTVDSEYHVSRISATFHGRDIFAPAAAHLACGLEIQAIGDSLPLSDLVILPNLEPQHQPDGTWLGEVLHIDRYGNLITNIQMQDTTSHLKVLASNTEIDRLSRTFSDVAPGQLLAYIGSSGYLEIAVREGSAAARLGIDVGAPVRIGRLS